MARLTPAPNHYKRRRPTVPMVYMSEPDDDVCYRCERDDRDLTEHRIHFFDDRDSKRVDLCAPCVRIVREADNPVRSIT